MTGESDWPTDVMAAIQAGRKIEAIKLLRDQRDMGLREAKEAVETYAKSNPDVPIKAGPKADSSIARVVLIAIVIAVGYGAYRALA